MSVTETIYLLTGATGLLGANILDQLLSEGAHVRVLVRDPSRKHVDDRADVVEGDLLDGAALNAFFETPPGPQVIVIHAAGAVTLDPNPNVLVHETNVTGTRNIVDQCVKHDVNKLVYVSSTSALPEVPSGKIEEAGWHDPTQVVGFYSETKAEASNLVLDAVEKRGLDASIVYPSGILGPGDHNLGLITSTIRVFAKGFLPVSIGGSFNSVDVRDLAAGIVSCAASGKPGGTYIMAGDTHTLTELLTLVRKETGLPPPWFTVPLRALRPLGWVGSQYSRLTKKPVLLTDYTIYNLERNNDFSSEKARTKLGFKSRPLEETVRDTIQWLRREDLL